jgi:hypothetical protein
MRRTKKLFSGNCLIKAQRRGQLTDDGATTTQIYMYIIERRDIQFLRLLHSKGYNTVGVSFPPPDDGNRSTFRNIVFLVT